MTSIGLRAFSGCTGLTSITIPNSVTTIGEYAFGNCGYLESIYVPINKFDEWFGSSITDNKTSLAIKLTTNSAGSAKYSTFYYASTLGSKPRFRADSNTTVYKAKQKDASTLTLTSISDRSFPDATGVVLKSTSNEIVLHYTDYPLVGDFSDNILEGTNEDMAVGSDTYYVLGLSGGNIGFYEFTGTTLAAHKAYIPETSIVGLTSRGLTMEEENETTSLSEELRMKSEDSAAATEWYTLDGRRVDNPTKGIYIRNGKKVIIK